MANEIVDPKTGEVTTLPPAFLKEMEADAKVDHQDFRQDQLIIPRITILQDLSPQVKEQKSEYIPGARPGLIYNNVTGDILQSLTFIPAFYTLRFIAWKPRKNGGGLVNSDVEEALLNEQNGFRKENPGKWVGKMAPGVDEDPVVVEVIMTGEWAGIARKPDGGLMPVAISFPGAKAKVGRKINSTIDLTEIEGKNGFFTPLPYAHSFTLTTGTETGPTGEDFWNYIATHDGWNTDNRALGKAKALRDAIKAGEADFADIQDADQ